MRKILAILLTAVLAACLLAVSISAVEPHAIQWSFEEGTLEPFTTEDDWGDIRLILDRDTDRNDGVTPMEKDGKYYLCTVFFEDQENYDESFTGSIKSPVFKIYDPIVTCLIAGGAPDNYVAICRASDNEEIATGYNILLQGHPFIEIELDLADNYVEGEEVYFKIVDGTTGGWGFISVDNIQAKGILVSEEEAEAAAAAEAEAAAAAAEAEAAAAAEAEAAAAEEVVVEEPEVVEAVEEAVAPAPQTGDLLIAAAAAAALSGAGYTLSKKKR